MQDILEMAGRLGKQVAADARAQRLAKARTAFDGNVEARRLIDEYERQQNKVAELEMTGKPIEPVDKRRLMDLHQQVISSPVLKDLLKAQADYVEMMALISERIEREALGSAAAVGPETS